MCQYNISRLAIKEERINSILFEKYILPVELKYERYNKISKEIILYVLPDHTFFLI